MSGARVLGDWGTTNLRLYRVEGGVVTARQDGPGALCAVPAQVLAERLAVWQAQGPIDDVVLCGMAGARGALVDAGYVACPADRDAWLARPSRTRVGGLDVTVLAGVCAHAEGGVPDVMRGEEAQIFGAMALEGDLAVGRHLIVLPGTHCKWVEVNDGVLQGFRTYPTGELFALLTSQSTLLGPDTPGEGVFEEGFARGLSRSGEALSGALFEARAARLLDARSREWSRGYISGLLIGTEVAAEAGLSASVVLIGDKGIVDLYETALTRATAMVRRIDGEAAALAGLALATGANA
ncbi:2-dehydro-3-deoxygalactonokinase [Novosphingobium sp. 1949]|uniref:2-dehydro-3-deoxygalactonokinase n=1 Tax=Novosphingobium organovorum TaxID=2930092 RepID=A0ABT0BCK3_9SPHN|nr:2-dehydro-3-deoxygalactonokinase [Novosphingobium organovorum]MCJ2182786.1 2-dehydro-3-deoxygalactonokinase [Novosphingobium organovorum]